jgi:protein-disulfide isomerase
MSQKASKEKRREQGMSSEKKMMMKKFIVAGIVVLAVVGLIVAIVMTRETAGEISDKSPDPTVGKADAAVVVRVYEDFQCPACAGVQPVLKDLIAQYSDRVKFIFNDFPLPQHKNATIAAVAAECVFGQGVDQYMAYSETLYDKQSEWQLLSTVKAQEKLRGYADELALEVDMTKFDSCVSDQATADKVEEDLEEGRALGVNSTPSFFVGDKKVSETPFSTTLKKEIDAALVAAQ